MKKRSQRLAVVQDLARRRKEQADQYLAEHLRLLAQDEQQLDQLKQYLREYQQAYQAGLAQGMAIDLLRNYQGFMQKIAVAIEQHQQTMHVHQQQLQQIRQHWTQMSGRHQAISTVVDKAHQQELQQADKQLQKQLDERAQHTRNQPD